MFKVIFIIFIDPGIDKSMNGKKIKCSATNKIQNAPFVTDKEHTLDVH